MAKPITVPPTLDDLAEIARVALTTLPEPLSAQIANVVIRVEEFCDEDTLRELELESPFDLLGLYRGIALHEKTIAATPRDVDMIFLYRRPILDAWCETGEDLAALVRHVLIHEIGHHFGFSDDDMERIEEQWP